MANKITFELEGLRDLLKEVETLADDIKEEIDIEMDASLTEMEATARRLAPVDMGFLRARITAKREATLSYELVAQSYYAPYVEFGTKTKVDVPAGLEDYAIQFWSGKRFARGGNRAQPFFFPAIFAVRPKMIERIKNILNEKRG
jgi:HK97 gp10 family phage protein